MIKTTCLEWQVAGRTRSGKIIPHMLHDRDVKALPKYFKNAGFHGDDLLDADAVFIHLAHRAMRQGGDEMIYEVGARKVENILGQETFEHAKKRAKIRTIFALQQLGRSLVMPMLRDL